MSSEISELRSTLQQSQRKIQEQSAHIVRLNSADVILKDNERLKEEIYVAKTEAWNAKNTYGKKLDQLEAVRRAAEEKKKKAEDVLAKERSLILSKGKMIADEQIKKEKQAHNSRIRCLKEDHRRAKLIRNRYIYLALVAIELSMIISLFQRDEYALNMIGYSRQVEEAGKSYRKKPDKKDGDLYAEDGTIKIRLSSEEFLSGFRKEDKLIPIITATVYLSADKWDGPLDLHDMIDVKDKGLLKFIPNYPINLIAPANMQDADFAKFSTDLGLAMKVLKHQKEKSIADIMLDSGHRKVDRSTAVFLNKVSNLGLVFDDKEGDVDMCKGMEEYRKETEVRGAIKAYQLDGKSDEDIIAKVMKLFDVSREYVLNLLSPKAV